MNEEQLKADMKLLEAWHNGNVCGVDDDFINILLCAQKRIVQAEERERFDNLLCDWAMDYDIGSEVMELRKHLSNNQQV